MTVPKSSNVILIGAFSIEVLNEYEMGKEILKDNAQEESNI